jgi:hypothetical protein
MSSDEMPAPSAHGVQKYRRFGGSNSKLLSEINEPKDSLCIRPADPMSRQWDAVQPLVNSLF